MRKSLKKLLALSVAAAMMVPATAFAGEVVVPEFNSTVDTNTEGEITIYIYYADASIATVDAAVAKMNAKYPNLKVNIEHRADSDGTALKTWAAVGELPDIINIPSADTYNTLLENGDLYPLDAAVEATGYYDYFINGDFYKEAHTEESDGKMYSFGNDVTNVFTVFYNREVFDELGLSEPTNYDEFKNCIVTLKEAGKIPIALFGAEQWPGMALYELACVAEGASSASNAVNAGEVKYGDDEAYAKAAAKMAEITELGAFGTGALSTNASQAFELESTGQAGFVVNGSWHWSTIETDGYGENTGWCHYNVFADADKAEEVQGKCIGGSVNKHNLSINANPPSGLDPEVLACLGLEFDYFLKASEGEMGLRTTAIGDFNLNGSESYIDFDKTYASFSSFTVWPQDMSNGSLVSALGNGIEMIVSGNYTAEDFMEEMAASGF